MYLLPVSCAPCRMDSKQGCRMAESSPLPCINRRSGLLLAELFPINKPYICASLISQAPYMNKKVQSALISVFYKDGLEPLVRLLNEQGVTIYSTGGTQQFIEKLEIPCVPVESVTSYPSILGGRVKTLHPKVFGGILARRGYGADQAHIAEYSIPLFDL